MLGKNMKETADDEIETANIQIINGADENYVLEDVEASPKKEGFFSRLGKKKKTHLAETDIKQQITSQENEVVMRKKGGFKRFGKRNLNIIRDEDQEGDKAAITSRGSEAITQRKGFFQMVRQKEAR